MKAYQLLLAATLGGAIGAQNQGVAMDKSAAQKMTPAAVKLAVEGELPSLGGATGWLNSQPLTAAGLRGKVVLIDVWTYTSTSISELRQCHCDHNGDRRIALFSITEK